MARSLGKSTELDVSSSGSGVNLSWVSYLTFPTSLSLLNTEECFVLPQPFLGDYGGIVYVERGQAPYKVRGGLEVKVLTLHVL